MKRRRQDGGAPLLCSPGANSTLLGVPDRWPRRGHGRSWASPIDGRGATMTGPGRAACLQGLEQQPHSRCFRQIAGPRRSERASDPPPASSPSLGSDVLAASVKSLAAMAGSVKSSAARLEVIHNGMA
ncbi:hypothetical protein ACQJBY_014296 [Aegilops geniculata]